MLRICDAYKLFSISHFRKLDPLDVLLWKYPLVIHRQILSLEVVPVKKRNKQIWYNLGFEENMQKHYIGIVHVEFCKFKSDQKLKDKIFCKFEKLTPALL